MTAEDKTNEESLDEGLDPRNLSIQGSVDESTVVVGDHNTIQHISVFSPITVGPATATPSQSLSKQEYRWRQTLVSKVKHYWIEGVLKKSLHNQVLIELGLEERSNAVASPLKGVREFPDEPGRTLPNGTQAIAIFDDMGAGRTLLILGNPGSGKTVTLLKLTQSLLERIGDDLSQPIPVILNLSSWARKRQPIAEWLEQDLSETFQVSKALGKAWIKDEQLVLCLDGLDEVDAKYRNECVVALNQFIQDHGCTEMVVCSRIKDYDALAEQLRLRSAIYVQPLTPRQVDHYLEQTGEQLTALRTVLNQNAELKLFATSPLILSVMSLVYQCCSLDKLPQLSNTENFRQQLFDAYVKRVFQRRDRLSAPYSSTQTTHWLIWIARHMVKTSQTVFLVQLLHPSCLHTRTQRLQFRLESALITGMFMGLFFGLSSGLFFGLSFELSFGLIGGLFFGLIGGLLMGLLCLRPPKKYEDLMHWEPIILNVNLNARDYFLLSGLFLGLYYVLSSGLLMGLLMGLMYGPVFGLTYGPIFGLMMGITMGGFVYIRVFSQRLIFYRMGYTPWNYNHFLDYAAEKIVLQKVGSGYIFIHRMLLEHFAQMELEQKHSE